jgi:hypothetical protein
MEITALEMAKKFPWAEVTLLFHDGHITVVGKTRIVDKQSPGNAVWVNNLCLGFNTLCKVEPVGTEGCNVTVNLRQY